MQMLADEEDFESNTLERVPVETATSDHDWLIITGWLLGALCAILAISLLL